MTGAIEQHYRRVFDLECKRYLAEAGLMRNLDRKYCKCVSAYILCSGMALPVKTIIIGERPYSTDIHPTISSAMSYDPSKTRATPSTVGVAMDLTRALGCKYAETERWFRDSWMYLASGTVVVNCTLFTNYSSSFASNEVVAFQRWIRSMIECSAAMSPSNIDVICMGVPSLNTVNSMLGSMGRLRSIVSKKTYPNPAIWSKLSACDARSQTYTFGKKGTSQSLLSAIHRSRDYEPLTVEDYISYMSQTPAKQLPQVARMLEKSRTLVDEIEDAYKELESNHRTPSLTEAYEEFARAMIEYRDSVLYDLVSASVTAAGDSSSKLGRATEWGSKKQWKKSTASIGNSSKMSVLSEDVAGVEQKFADYGGEPVAFADEDQAEKVEEIPEVKPKKKKIIKRVVRRPKSTQEAPKPTTSPSPAPSETMHGSKLTADNISALRVVGYYLSEISTDSSSALQTDISASMNKGIAKTSDIGLIVDTIARDLADVGKDASASLGMDDGVVDEKCILPKLLAKLTEG